MGNLRKIVGISLAVAVAVGLVAYLLVPHAGPANESVVVNQPQAPTSPGGTGTGSGTSPSGGGSGGSSGGSGTSTPPTEHVKPPKLHGKNSEGPKHVVCLAVNDHVQGHAQYQGANWYRGTCTPGAGANSQGHVNGVARANGHAPDNGSAADAAHPNHGRGH